MRRSLLLSLSILALVVSLTSCSNPFGGGSDNNDNPQSVIAIDATAEEVTPQKINIELGDLDTWDVETKVTYFGSSCMRAGMATESISDSESAQLLDLGDGINDTSCLSYDDAQTKSFTSTLVAGKYVVTLYGSESPVTITVTKGGKPGTGGTVTKDTNATTTVP